MFSNLLLRVLEDFLYRIYDFHPVLVVGDSMEPTFHGGHFVFTKNSFTREDLTYNTVIVFSTDDSRLIKRIVALPGDTVIVKSDGVYVNNELQKDNFGTPSPVMDKPVTLGEDEYFVLGDNRDYSLDSRTIGAVPFEKITHIVTTESH